MSGGAAGATPEEIGRFTVSSDEQGEMVSLAAHPPQVRPPPRPDSSSSASASAASASSTRHAPRARV